jgi:hypothetical protein
MKTRQWMSSATMMVTTTIGLLIVLTSWGRSAVEEESLVAVFILIESNEEDEGFPQWRL